MISDKEFKKKIEEQISRFFDLHDALLSEDRIYDLSEEEEAALARVVKLTPEERARRLREGGVDLARINASLDRLLGRQERQTSVSEETVLRQLADGVRLVVERGRMLLEQTRGGMERIDNLYTVTAMNSGQGAAKKKLQGELEEEVQVAAVSLRAKEQDLLLGVRWLGVERPAAPPEVEVLCCSQLAEATWSNWSVAPEEPDRILIVKDGFSKLEGCEIKDLVVRTGWDSEGNVLTLAVAAG